ncbi:hypothetical protein [Dysgonomonas sp. HGC4]|uniref:hypothetical protein n=1 Tax=Dysgonomonas sp. HGC4 TaxID=1658009 RepID=UPI00177C4626|nr:hypothetical protein [Dysgonomonas sp. HGC4]MBD8347790.1 hypothetical protein [Dysgonomonas sp. HGC4]
MKSNEIKSLGFKKMKIWCILLVVMGFLVGCTSEEDVFVPPGPVDPSAENVTFEVFVPGLRTPSAYGMTQDQEANVNEFTILAFRKDNDMTERLKARVVATSADINNAGNGTGNVTVKVFIPGGAYNRLVLISNANAQVAGLTVGSTDGQGSELALLNAIEYAHSGKWDTATPAYIPMSAQIIAATDNDIIISPGVIKTFNNLKLVRMLAKVNVTNSATASFSLTDVILYNFSENGLLVNDLAKYALSVPQPNLPGSLTVSSTAVTYAAVSNNKLEDEIYTFEAPAATAAGAVSPRIILKGTYAGDGQTYYYPVDFTYGDDRPNGTAKGDFRPIVRNYKYIFNVSKVFGPGFATAAGALNSTGVYTNIEATLIAFDNDFLHVFHDDQNFLATDKEEFVFSFGERNAGSTDNILTLLGSLNWSVTCTEEDGTPVTGGWLSTSVSTGNQGQNVQLQVFVTRLTGSVFRKGYLRIAVEDRFIVRVPVTQTAVFAGSNIYYDAVAGHLTFGGIDDPSKEMYQGVLFKFGSLTGIAPTPANYSTSTVTYPPSGGSTTSSPDWSSIPYTNTGDLVHDQASIAQGKGDICKYLTSQGWAPPGNWRLPTKDELVFILSNGGSWVNGTNTSGNDAGTNSIASGWRNSINNYSYFLPASGNRVNGTGTLYDVGTVGSYWSSSPDGLFCYYLSFDSSVVYPDSSYYRAYGFTIRCIEY